MVRQYVDKWELLSIQNDPEVDKMEMNFSRLGADGPHNLLTASIHEFSARPMKMNRKQLSSKISL